MNLGPRGSVRAVSQRNSTHQEKEDYLISPTSLLEAQKSKGLILNVKSLLSWATKSLRTVTAATEIKRRLLLGRKVTTNLDSLLKSRDITLPTNVHLLKDMIFLVVMYGCESWTIKKAEH